MSEELEQHRWLLEHGQHQERPGKPAEETEKALDLIVPILGRKRSTALLDALWKFDRIADVRALRKLYVA